MYNKHYIRTDENGFIIKAFSDAFEQPLVTDICVNEDGGRHYNPNIKREDGLPVSKYKDGKIVELTEEELQPLIDALPVPEVLPTVKELMAEITSLKAKDQLRVDAISVINEKQTAMLVKQVAYDKDIADLKVEKITEKPVDKTIVKL